jgi:DNA helicase-2/ATP-dependent DNA helicase PcrA
VVFMVNLVEQRFPPDRRSEGLEFPPELKAGSLAGADDDSSDEHYREERRLFYVGMTRAKDRLVLTHAADYGGKRATRLSRFVREALDLPVEPKGAQAASALESIRRHAPVAELEPAPLAPVAEGQPLTLSHSQIDDWITCPFKYRYAHIAHMPLAGDPVFTYGTAMHHAIKIWHQHRIKGLPIHADDVVAAFESAWSSEGFYTREHEERMLAQGRAALRRFVERDAAGRPPLAVETEFKFKVDGDVVIGRWDRIDERAEGIVLVDYKTSEVDEAEKAEERAKRSLRDGQLGLYALAYVESRQVMPASVELQFVDTGISGNAAVEAEHLERARERVREAAAGIRTGRFPPRPDQRNCGYCAYRRFCPHSVARRG